MALSNNQVLGIVLIVLGALVLLGYLDIPALSEILAVILIVVGILILMGTVKGASWLGVLLIVLGILLLLPRLPYIDEFLDALVKASNVVIGVVLLVVGILKTTGKA